MNNKAPLSVCASHPHNQKFKCLKLRVDFDYNFNIRYVKLPKFYFDILLFMHCLHPCTGIGPHFCSAGMLQKERCNWSTLIFPHVKKLLLTWHFLTSKGYSRGEKRGREKVKHKWIQKRCSTMMSLSFPVNSPHFSPL